MTKKQLLELLEPYPDNMDIFIEQTSNDPEFSLSLLESVTQQEASFSDGALKAKDNVLILSDEA